MSRDRVYQLRLTSEEKERLFHLAQERELSIAGMIRKDYGLAEAPSRPPAKADNWKPREKPIPEIVREQNYGEKPILPPQHSASEIKRLARQRHPTLPLGFAEMKVRKELG